MTPTIRNCLWKKDRLGNYGDLVHPSLLVCRRTNDGYERENFKENMDRDVSSLPLNLGGKNNTQANLSRKLGHTLKNATYALDAYNESLRHAEENSLAEVLAIANRGRVLMLLGYFDDALNDMKTVKEKKLPYYMRPIINAIEEDAKKGKKLLKKYDREQIEKGLPPSSYNSELTFDENKKYPCIADVLKIGQSKNEGRFIVAKYDLLKNDIILKEKDYIHSFTVDNPRFLRNCNFCHEEDRNFIACRKCSGK